MREDLREKPGGRSSHATNRLLSKSLKRCFITAGCCFFSFTVLAQSDQRITLNLQKATLEQVIWEIQKKTGFTFMYGSNDIQTVRNITLNEKDKSIREILDKCLRGTSLTYEISGKEIIIKQATADAKQQTGRRVKGTVVSKEDGLPVIGASIRVDGTELGVATDIDGNFSLNNVPDGAQLVVSYIGMKTLTVAATPNMTITLENDAQALDDVVVTGIFKKAKESYTGAVSTITSEQLDMYKGQNLLQTLKNIDASINFTVNNIAGSNPNNLPQINIRGNSSLPMSVEEFNQTASNDINRPLIILDGFEISLEKLMDYNDEEIESFLPGIYRKLEWLSKEDLIKRVVSMEFNRFLEYYSNAPEIETPSMNDRRSEREPKGRKDHGSAREKTERKAEKGYTRLFLNVGKTDGFYANQIIELINRNMKKQRTTIGRIDLMQNFSFFEVAENQAQDVIKALNKVNLNGGRKIVVEVAGDNNGKNDNGERRSSAARNASFGKKSDRSNKKTTSKEGKTSRAERGYIEERGPKTKDDWKQFFNSDNNKKKKSKK